MSGPSSSLMALAMMMAATGVGALTEREAPKPSDRDTRTDEDVAERVAKQAAKLARRAARNKK